MLPSQEPQICSLPTLVNGTTRHPEPQARNPGNPSLICFFPSPSTCTPTARPVGTTFKMPQTHTLLSPFSLPTRLIQATITSHQNDSNSFLTGLPALTHALHAFHVPLSFFPSFFPSSLFSPSLFFPGFLLFSLSPSNPLFFLSFCFKMYILLLFRYMRPTYLMIAIKITVGYISQEERACHTMQGHTGKQ